MTIAELKQVAVGSKLKSVQTGGVFTVNRLSDNGFDLVSDATGKHLVTRVNCDAANRPVGWQTPEPTSNMIRWTEQLASKVADTLIAAE